MSEKYVKKSVEELKENLIEIQYKVTQENATEAPFGNDYNSFNEKGIYVNITTGEPLFISSDEVPLEGINLFQVADSLPFPNL